MQRCLVLQLLFVQLLLLLDVLLHQLQLLQDRLVLDAHNYCDERLVRHLQVPDATAI